MSGEVLTLSDSEARRVLEYEEGHFGDLKSRETSPSAISEAVSAFANADGGELFIGVDEKDRERLPRRWRGFTRVEDANAHVQVLGELFPLGANYSFSFLQHGEKSGFLLHVEIPKSRTIIKATSGMPFVRRGAQKLSINTDDKLRQLERNKGISSYESETVAVGADVITNSATTIGFMLEVIPTAEPDVWLRKNSVLIEDLPTVAGILLFADEPQAVLPKQSGIKVYRYGTTAGEGTRETLMGDPISIEGSAYDLIHTAVAKTEELIAATPTLGAEGLESVRYPTVTLHEIITNAVLHRDYSIPDDIHVRIFDNRVEVVSPGVLPGHITETNFLQERFSRNGVIVRLINKFPNPPNKDVGEGLNSAFAAMKSMRLREPELRQLEHSVIVYIRHTRLASPEDAVMDHLSRNHQITNAEGRDLTGLRSDDTMKNVFGRLRDRKQIEMVPGTRGRSSAWRKVVADDQITGE